VIQEFGGVFFVEKEEENLNKSDNQT